MRLTHVRLLVQDFAGCLAFYRDVLGLEATLDTGDEIYAEIDAGQAIIGLYRDELMAGVLGAEAPTGPSGEDATVLCFQVDDVDLAYRNLVAKGAAAVKEPHDQEAWYLRVAHIRDPDGNLIELNQPLPS